jgi:hypothetical protein
MRSSFAAHTKPFSESYWTVYVSVPGNDSRGADLHSPELLANRVTKALTAGDRRAPCKDHNDVTARGAADLPHVIQVDEAGATDSQHRLRLQGLLRMLQRAAGRVRIPPDRESNVVSIGFDHLHAPRACPSLVAFWWQILGDARGLEAVVLALRAEVLGLDCIARLIASTSSSVAPSVQAA